MLEYKKSELAFGLNTFNKPQEYTKTAAWARLITELCMHDRGNFPSNPEMGVGIKRYDFEKESDRTRLLAAINEQVKTYLPDIPVQTIVLDTQESEAGSTILLIYITFNTENGLETVAVAAQKKVNYIKFAISM